MPKHKNYRLVNNSRFYILTSSVALSLFILGGLKITIPSDQLFYIRLEQLYGLLAVLYWYVAVLISPLGYIVGKEKINQLTFARRAIGVSAAYFAVLHTIIAIFGQLGGIQELRYLPNLFVWSLTLGGLALTILLIMAATSFDKVVSIMTFRYWKWLHRLIYIGGVFVVIHIWSVGTHMASLGIQVVAFSALVLLGGLEIYRTSKNLANKYRDFQSRDYFLTLFVVLMLIWISLLFAIPGLIDNYHSKHQQHSHIQELGDRS